MASAIGGIEGRTPEVEVVTMWVAGIDGEMPVAAIPVERTVEISCGTEGLPLPVEQNIAHVEVTALPIGGKDIVVTGDTHQVVEIDLVGGLILRISEIQLVGHFVGEEQGLVASLLVAHCMPASCYGQHGNKGYYHLLHNCKEF